MSEDLKRVQLDDATSESVTGGRILFYSVEGEPCYLYKRSEPTVHYYFEYEDMQAVQKVKLENADKGDDGIIAALFEAELIHM